MKKLNWPLMENNISKEGLNAVIRFLKSSNNPILTQSKYVRKFEEEWSKWLGVKYSVLVNSGSSANLLSMLAIKEMYGLGEVIVPPLTWVSDIASVIQSGLKLVFVDINRRTLGMDNDQVIKKINSKTKAIFLTHILGYNGISQKLLDEIKSKKIPLVEDVCESYGATFKNKKLGTFGLMSNFSFYYAHHMTTVEGGMISTNNPDVYELLRMLRAHGMVREADSISIKKSYQKRFPDLNPDFIFAYPAYNMRSNEIAAVMGLSQLKNLSRNNSLRSGNLKIFLSNLNPDLYQTDFAIEGSCNYAFVLVLRKQSMQLAEKVMRLLKTYGVEFRRGTSGGGNQLRQPYLKKIIGDKEYKKYPNVEHIHFYGFYIGNYPTLKKEKIFKLCKILNNL
jgi:CDP-4-dehydro-6-deoxyglucose reductase, E1